MSYITFDKNKLVNLEYSLPRELLRSNKAGAYACTTLTFCNTRKYHGLLVVPQPNFDNDCHVLLSSVDETIIEQNHEFNLGLHKYPDNYSPKGHKYIVDFQLDPIPSHVYQLANIKLKKEIIFSSEENRIFIRYTLLSKSGKLTLRLSPFLAFRNYHALSKENHDANTGFQACKYGTSMRLYEGYSELFMQFSQKPIYHHNPYWFHNIEYKKELDRGYEGHEDLMVPGYFELTLSQTKPIIASFGVSEINPIELPALFEKETSSRIPRDTFENCLANSALQFIIKKQEGTFIKAGFPWHDIQLRDTFISIPGVSLTEKNIQLFYELLNSAIRHPVGPHFALKANTGLFTDYSADTSLWFIWSLQQFIRFFNVSPLEVWQRYGSYIKNILYGYRDAQSPSVSMKENGLLYVFMENKALTWMNATVQGTPVTHRQGFTCETNALWFNAIMFALSLAKQADDKQFVDDWNETADIIPESYKSLFWNKNLGYVADYANENKTDWSIRPNMLLAASLEYSPLSKKIQQLVISTVKKKLLTPFGIRTLSPDDPNYKSVYWGCEQDRAKSTHQGTATPWLIGHYADAFLKIYDKSGLYEIEQLYKGFEKLISDHCIGSISELFDGDPPHRPGAAISQAWCVAEIIRLRHIIDFYQSEGGKL